MDKEILDVVDSFNGQGFKLVDVLNKIYNRYVDEKEFVYSDTLHQLNLLTKIGYIDKAGDEYIVNTVMQEYDKKNLPKIKNMLTDKIKDVIDYFEYKCHNKLSQQSVEELKQITIEFSDELKTKTSEGYTVEEIRTKIDEVLEENGYSPRLRELLVSIRGYLRENKPEKLSDLIGQYKEEVGWEIINSDNELTEELKTKLRKLIDIFTKRQFTYRINGEFDAQEFKIVLYINNINMFDENEFFALVIFKTFAHELFHAYHYLSVNEKGKEWKYDVKTEIIVESLASFAERAIVEDLIRPGEDKILSSWFEYDMHIYPYAGAKYIYNDIFMLVRRFFRPLFRSFTSHVTRWDRNKNPYKDFRQYFLESLESLELAQKELELRYKYEKEVLVPLLVANTPDFLKRRGE